MMRLGRSKMPLISTASLLVILLASAIVMSQTPTGSMGRTDPPKTEGAVRIGLALPRVSLIGASGSVSNEATSLRQTVSSYLTGPRIGTVDLKARLDSLALEEGQERQCDYVLYTSLIRKRQQTGPATSGTFSGTKAEEEITFEYKLVSGDGMQAAAANVATARVKFDGEDILTPMIEASAEAVVNIARKARTAPPVVTAKSGTSLSDDVPQPRPTPSPEASKAPTGYDLLIASPSKARTAPSVSDPPKAEGAIRIGIVTSRVSLIGGGGMGKESSAVGESVSSYLGGSTIETINLNARLDSLALDEGKKRACDYVLYTSLIRKRQGNRSNGAGSLGGIMGTLGGSGVGNKIPGGKAAQTISSGAATAVANIASLARAKDEVIFEYRLVPIDGARSGISNVAKAKVKSDGEDVLTPMIEAAAQAIVDVTKKN